MHAAQELRRILLKNALSAEVALHRAGSAAGSVDAMLQRQADVEYDQRSRFASLGASPSDGFLQDACLNRYQPTEAQAAVVDLTRAAA